MAKTYDLTTGNIKKTIIRMTLPMIFGMIGLVAFNFADTAFVGQLGGAPLAALVFTFPIVMIIQSVAHGLGVGTGSVIARVAAKCDKVKRYATDGLILSFVVVVIVVVVGTLTIEPLFYGMGATKDEMPYIQKYMTIWYLGVPMVVIPIVGNYIIRALGDTRVPGLVMLIAAGLNILIDPLLIFGIGFFPKLGVVGAALATVISRFFTLLVELYVLIKREKLITFKDARWENMRDSFLRILHVGIPSTITKAVTPFGTYFITWLLASYGTSVVAGYGAGAKTEVVVLSVINALAAIMISFAGQNYGADNIKRLRNGFRYACWVNIIYSIGIYILLFFAAPFIASLFNTDPLIISTTILYIRIALAGLAFQGILQIVTSAYNAVGKPYLAMVILIIQMFGLYIPLSFLLSSFMGQTGVYLALVVSYVISASIAYLLFIRFLKNAQQVEVNEIKEYVE